MVEDFDFREVEEEESCSSPEQETVTKRPDSGFRGPPGDKIEKAFFQFLTKRPKQLDCDFLASL